MKLFALVIVDALLAAAEFMCKGYFYTIGVLVALKVAFLFVGKP